VLVGDEDEDGIREEEFSKDDAICGGEGLTWLIGCGLDEVTLGVG
jgi:hypothetical protein